MDSSFILNDNLRIVQVWTVEKETVDRTRLDRFSCKISLRWSRDAFLSCVYHEQSLIVNSLCDSKSKHLLRASSCSGLLSRTSSRWPSSTSWLCKAMSWRCWPGNYSCQRETQLAFRTCQETGISQLTGIEQHGIIFDEIRLYLQRQCVTVMRENRKS